MRKFINRIMSALVMALFCCAGSTAQTWNGVTGFATCNALGTSGVTGGGAGEVVHVSTRADLARYASSPQPSVIIIDKGQVLKAEDKDSLLENIYMVSGDRSEVEEATKNCTIISRTSILGQEKVLVEGEVENENVKKERVDLQRYFVEITKDGE